jgi:hypothetical protein
MWVCKVCDWRRVSGPEETWDTCPNCNNFQWMQEGERNDIKWITAPPTEEGWYWAQWAQDVGNITCVEVSYSLATQELEVWVTAKEYTYELKDFTHWLGPLPVPEPPAENK